MGLQAAFLSMQPLFVAAVLATYYIMSQNLLAGNVSISDEVTYNGCMGSFIAYNGDEEVTLGTYEGCRYGEELLLYV